VYVNLEKEYGVYNSHSFCRTACLSDPSGMEPLLCVSQDLGCTSELGGDLRSKVHFQEVLGKLLDYVLGYICANCPSRIQWGLIGQLSPQHLWCGLIGIRYKLFKRKKKYYFLIIRTQ